ncbi:MAG: putative midasin [Streblomastix strix]|uniref:Putative midasin n=1 Tax=Streblomastix strix TaxID=222440 RepID=A0A5J4UV57_9EUKA|nr:MAG: putative midasin [Streblomastix strix]
MKEKPSVIQIKKSCSLLSSLFDKEEISSNQQESSSPHTHYISTLPSTLGLFEWVDGILINSMIQGDWIMIQGVNQTSPTVLDRINPLLEIDTNGILEITEQGQVEEEEVDEDEYYEREGKQQQQSNDNSIHAHIRKVKSHPLFRLFFVMDEKEGEISRAMRNRGIEIAVIDQEEEDDENDDDKIEIEEEKENSK